MRSKSVKIGMTAFNKVVLFVILFAVWVVLSGYLNPFFLTLGAISCLISVYVAVQLSKNSDHFSNLFIRLIKIPLYFFWLVKEIIISSLAVTKIVWSPKLNINPILAWIPSSQKDDISITCFANSITLTPGTVSILVEDGRICVHGLQKDSLEELAKGDMDKRVSQCMGVSS